LCAGGTLPIERTEPATAQAKAKQHELWYYLVNEECDCDTAQQCGDRYRSLVQKISAAASISNEQLLKRLNVSVRNLRRNCWSTKSTHYSKQSATCDHEHMPKELLPRLRAKHMSPDKWPYVSQSTVNAVKAMRTIRSTAASTQTSTTAMWLKLQPRLQQYDATGAGTVAEAIVSNDYWWSGQVAHEQPTKANSQAAKRGQSIA
jgi:hypothetical protein